MYFLKHYFDFLGENLLEFTHVPGTNEQRSFLFSSNNNTFPGRVVYSFTFLRPPLSTLSSSSPNRRLLNRLVQSILTRGGIQQFCQCFSADYPFFPLTPFIFLGTCIKYLFENVGEFSTQIPLFKKICSLPPPPPFLQPALFANSSPFQECPTLSFPPLSYHSTSLLHF